jgi:hypothetical protein
MGSLVNTNPLSENSPNLVTLKLGFYVCLLFSSPFGKNENLRGGGTFSAASAGSTRA